MYITSTVYSVTWLDTAILYSNPGGTDVPGIFDETSEICFEKVDL